MLVYQHSVVMVIYNNFLFKFYFKKENLELLKLEENEDEKKLSAKYKNYL